MCQEASTTKDGYSESLSGVQLLGAAAMGAMAVGVLGVGVLSMRRLLLLEEKLNGLHGMPRTRSAAGKKPRLTFLECAQAAGVHRDPVTGLPDECNP